MKKRIISIVLALTLVMSGSTMAWAAPEGEVVSEDVFEQGGNVEDSEEIQDELEPTEQSKEDLSEEVQNDELENITIYAEDVDIAGAEINDSVLYSDAPRAGTVEGRNGSSLFAGGKGTAEDPFQITTAEQMNNVRQNMAASYALMNDIDLSGYSNWEPIGTSEAPFVGTFAGNNHTINGLIITEGNQGDYYGLFGYCENSCIKTLNVAGNISITSNSNLSIGGIVGSGNNIAVQSCKNNVEICLNNGNSVNSCGGIVGTIFSEGETTSAIINCINNGNINVVAYGAHCGGICGSLYRGSIQYCINHGNCEANSSIGGVGEYFPSATCGGIIGESTDDKNKIDSCVNDGNIKGFAMGGSASVCGIIGDRGIERSIVKNCFNLGNLEGSTSTSYTDNSKKFRICCPPFNEDNGTGIEGCYSLESVLVNEVTVTEDIGADQPNGANLSKEEIDKRIEEIFGGKPDDAPGEEVDTSSYIKEHVDFINSSEYAGRMDNCWAKTISQGLDTPTGKIGETMYNTLNTGSELISGKCKSLSIFENPYDAIIVELILAQTGLEESSFELKYKSDLLSSISKIESICKKADPGWSLENTEYKTSLEKLAELIENPQDYKESNPAFYDMCNKIFD